MAPMKREFVEMMFDQDPVFEIDVVAMPTGDRSSKRCKSDSDFSTYLATSEDEFDATVPSSEILEFSILSETLMSGASLCKNAFGGRPRMFETTWQETALDDLSSDLSNSDDDNGYSTMFNSPVPALSADFAPFVDDMSVADAAESLLAGVDPLVTSSIVEAVTSYRTNVPDLSPLDPTARTLTKDGKPVNPTRWVHNSTERRRRLEIRRLFSTLRDLFPDIANDEKVSNITTLSRAMDHLLDLKRKITEQEADLVAMRERNAVLKSRAAEASVLRQAAAASFKASASALSVLSVPPQATPLGLPVLAAVVLEGNANSEVRKTLPAALRQLLDHNSRGTFEQKPLSRRRLKIAMSYPIAPVSTPVEAM